MPPGPKAVLCPSFGNVGTARERSSIQLLVTTFLILTFPRFLSWWCAAVYGPLGERRADGQVGGPVPSPGGSNCSASSPYICSMRLDADLIGSAVAGAVAAAAVIGTLHLQPALAIVLGVVLLVAAGIVWRRHRSFHEPLRPLARQALIEFVVLAVVAIALDEVLGNTINRPWLSGILTRPWSASSVRTASLSGGGGSLSDGYPNRLLERFGGPRSHSRRSAGARTVLVLSSQSHGGTPRS